MSIQTQAARLKAPILGLPAPMGQLAADLHRLGAFITAHDLPAGDVSLFSESGCIIVAVTSKFAVIRWAQTLHTEVTVKIGELHGRPATLFDARGYTDSVQFVHVSAATIVNCTTQVPA